VLLLLLLQQQQQQQQKQHVQQKRRNTTRDWPEPLLPKLREPWRQPRPEATYLLTYKQSLVRE
jgi:hypothetical protein